MSGTVLAQSPFQTTIWQPGHTYSPGDIIQPTTTVNAGVSPPTNADFVGSLAGWTASANVFWDATGYTPSGGSARVDGGHPSETLVNNNQVAVSVGQTINALCYITGNVTLGVGQVTIRLHWYDAGHALLSTTDSAPFGLSSLGDWWQLPITGSAPTGAAFCAIGVDILNTSPNPVYVDAFYWDYIVPSASATGGIVSHFTNISSGAATSGANEPDWTNGGTNVGNVVDGGITWARGVQEAIEWQCQHFCHSAFVEPPWALATGQVTPDGYPGGGVNFSGFDWVTRTPQILDKNCPQSKYVAIGSSHIFAADKDITRYCAVVNCTDWTSEDDAGYLATGLQNFGSNPTTGLELYRSNLAVFNAEACMLWQIDEDPGNMYLLDVIPIGSVWHKALSPVNDDLFFLAAQGVRSMKISGGSGNLEAGDIGMPVDPLSQAAEAYCLAHNTEPMGIYVPSAGQYFLVFPGWDGKDQSGNALFYPLPSPYDSGDIVFVYTMSRVGEVGAWCRYVFPFLIESWCIHGGLLYIKTTDSNILYLDTNAKTDLAGSGFETPFIGVVQWHWLDFGQTGTTKMFHTMDLSISRNTQVSVQLGFDQSNAAAWTDAFVMPADSVPGMQIPIPIMAPSMAVRLIFTSSDGWQVDAVNVYLSDMSVMS